MLNFGLRNLTLFIKDKTTVLLSFLAEFIILGLYLLFLRDNLISGFAHVKNAELLLDVWMIAGVLGVTSVTTTMGAYGVMVDDRIKKISRDFDAAPIRPFSLLGGYMASAVTIGLLLSFLVLVLSEVYVFYRYGVKLGQGSMLTVYGILLLSTVSNSSMVLLLVSFLKTNNALAACCTILGALIGFLTGIYLPMGSLPEGVRGLITCFPVSHGVVLLRQTLLEPLLVQSFDGLDTVPALQFSDYMGVSFSWQEKTLPAESSIFILLVAAVLFFCLGILNMLRQKRH